MKVPFSAVPIGGSFYDPSGEWCVKISDREVRDGWCAPGFCFEFDANLIVEIDERKLS